MRMDRTPIFGSAAHVRVRSHFMRLSHDCSPKILQIIQKFCAIKSEKAVLTGTIVSTLSEIKRLRAGELPVQIQILKHLIQSVVVRMRRHHVGDVL